MSDPIRQKKVLRKVGCSETITRHNLIYNHLVERHLDLEGQPVNSPSSFLKSFASPIHPVHRKIPSLPSVLPTYLIQEFTVAPSPYPLIGCQPTLSASAPPGRRRHQLQLSQAASSLPSPSPSPSSQSEETLDYDDTVDIPFDDLSRSEPESTEVLLYPAAEITHANELSSPVWIPNFSHTKAN